MPPPVRGGQPAPAKRSGQPAPAEGRGEPAPAPSKHRIRPMDGGAEMQLEGRRLKLTNLDKAIYPKTGFTKGDLIDFYLSIAPILAHLRDRPLTVVRYPDGVDGKSFFEKQSPSHRPSWVRTAPIWSEHSKREVRYTLCNDAKTLVWLANLAAVELHPSLSQAGAMQRPTTLVLDLDPGAPAGMLACCEVALSCGRLRRARHEVVRQTSGSKGLAGVRAAQRS